MAAEVGICFPGERFHFGNNRVQGFIPGCGFQDAILLHQGSADPLPLIFHRDKTTQLAGKSCTYGSIPVTFDSYEVVIPGEHFDAATNRATCANGCGFFNLGFASFVGAPPVDDGSSGANLDAHAAGDARADSHWDADVAYQQAVGTAFFESQGEVPHQFTASAHTASAKDAAVVLEDEIWV